LNILEQESLDIKNILGKPSHRILDVATGNFYPTFAIDYDLGSAIVNNRTIYVSVV